MPPVRAAVSCCQMFDTRSVCSISRTFVAIDRYVKEYQKEAEAAELKMEFEASSSGKQLLGSKPAMSGNCAAHRENGRANSDGFSLDDHRCSKRKKTYEAVDPESVIDLTLET